MATWVERQDAALHQALVERFWASMVMWRALPSLSYSTLAGELMHMVLSYLERFSAALSLATQIDLATFLLVVLAKSRASACSTIS